MVAKQGLCLYILCCINCSYNAAKTGPPGTEAPILTAYSLTIGQGRIVRSRTLECSRVKVLRVEHSRVNLFAGQLKCSRVAFFFSLKRRGGQLLPQSGSLSQRITYLPMTMSMMSTKSMILFSLMSTGFYKDLIEYL